MKKIIVFLSMFLFTGGILMAQTPKLSYDVLLRDNENKLLYNQEPVNVHVSVFDIDGSTSLYDEDVTGLSTDANALLQVEFGEAVDWAALGVDWSRARVNLNINCNGKTITHEVPVYAVPYAMQAANVPNALTTDVIIDYIGGITFSNDVRRILRALHENPNGLEQDLVDTITSYLKNHKDEAKAGFLYYLDHTTAGEIQATYDAMVANTAAFEKGVDVMVDYAEHHMDEAIEIALYFINNYTTAEDGGYVNDFISTLKANTEVYDVVKAYLEDIFKEYLDNHHFIQATDCTTVDPCTIH